MELKDFISNTIEQISLGVLDASEKCNRYGVIVNPNITIGEQGDFCIPKQPEHVNIQRRVQLIDMDIAVTVIESEEGKASLAILQSDMTYSDQLAGAVAYLGYKERLKAN